MGQRIKVTPAVYRALRKAKLLEKFPSHEDPNHSVFFEEYGDWEEVDCMLKDGEAISIHLSKGIWA